MPPRPVFIWETLQANLHNSSEEGSRPVGGKRSKGSRPLGGKRGKGSRPVSGKRGKWSRPVGGKRGKGSRPVSEKRAHLLTEYRSSTNPSINLPFFADEEEFQKFSDEHSSHMSSTDHSHAYLKLDDGPLLPGIRLTTTIHDTRQWNNKVIKYWSNPIDISGGENYANKLLGYLEEDRRNGLHRELTTPSGGGGSSEPPMYVDVQNYVIDLPPLQSKIRLFSSPYVEVCKIPIDISGGKRIIRYKTPTGPGIYTHTCPLWLFENQKGQTSGTCRLDIMADPDAISRVFGYSQSPVGFQNQHHCAVQLKSEYVLCVYDMAVIRKELLHFDIENMNISLIIYKCVTVKLEDLSM